MLSTPEPVPTVAGGACGVDPVAAGKRVALRVGEMSCASCAARVQKRLNRLVGVAATVNYATEIATVFYLAPATPEQVIDEITRAGYTATPTPAQTFAAAHARTPDAAVGDGRAGEGRERRPEPGDADPDQQSRARLWIVGLLSVPVVAMSMVPALQIQWWQWLALSLAGPVVVWGALPIHRAAWTNARHGTATMDTLICLGIAASFGWSLYALFFGSAGAPGMDDHFQFSVDRAADSDDTIYLEVACAVTTFILLGRYLEARAKRGAGAALGALLDLAAPDVAVLDPTDVTGAGVERRVSLDALSVGDRFVVRPGEKIATDGMVEQGNAHLDTSMLTGEALPRTVGVGDQVTGATVDLDGRLVVRATRVGAGTLLARISETVCAAQAGKAAIARLADRVAAVFVPIVIALAAATVGAWLTAGAPVATAVATGVAVLIIACPCALGLATPTALLVGTGRAAQLGIVIKSPRVLESTRRINTVVFDKTGTLTTAAMRLNQVITAPGEHPAQVLEWAAAVEQGSEHPLARAIRTAAGPDDPNLGVVEQFRAVAGLGVHARLGDTLVGVGRPSFLASLGMVLPPELNVATDGSSSTVAVGWDHRVRGLLVISDTLKPGSAQAVARLRALGLDPILLTGDQPEPAGVVAAALGITTVLAGVLPEGKTAAVRELQAQGKVVAMVGDGINDAAALATADLGIAMGTGTDAAIEAADLTVVAGDPRAVAEAITLARATLAVIRTNLCWALGYNLTAIPLAAAGLLNPMIAGAAMAASSLFVVGNSLRLRRFTTNSGSGAMALTGL